MGSAALALALGPATAPLAARADTANPLFALIDAAAQRLQTADPVAAYKWVNNAAINDPGRVQQVLAAVSTDATDNHVDVDYVKRVFNDQIDATDAIEYTRFAQWKLDPASAPTAAPQLSASRASIDALNRRMVTEIAAQWDVLHSPTCGMQMQDAADTVSTARGLDSLYRQAITFATRSYCG